MKYYIKHIGEDEKHYGKYYLAPLRGLVKGKINAWKYSAQQIRESRHIQDALMRSDIKIIPTSKKKKKKEKSKNMQLISRKGNFDSGHRVMNEAMKCFNIHGHTYLYELTFQHENMEDIGYAIDFKEIKRVFCQWIDDVLDHGMILNPKDELLIKTTKDYKSKLWLMSLNGAGQYCNPSVENITREVFLAIDVMCSHLYPNQNIGLKLWSVKIYETPNCASECFRHSISERERENFENYNEAVLTMYADKKGVKEYDDRKTKI